MAKNNAFDSRSKLLKLMERYEDDILAMSHTHSSYSHAQYERDLKKSRQELADHIIEMCGAGNAKQV